MNKQLALFIIWSTVTALSLGFAVQQPELAEPAGPAIAKLRKRQGTVQFRGQGATLWVDAGTRQVFQDGTLIATGSGSKANVVFRNGRTIELGESSQVVLTLGDDSDDSIVTLLKGSLRSRKVKRAASANERRLVINAGDKSVALAKREDHVVVAKAIGKATSRIELLGGLPVVMESVAIEADRPILPISKLATSEVDFAPLPAAAEAEVAPEVAVITPSATDPQPPDSLPEDSASKRTDEPDEPEVRDVADMPAPAVRRTVAVHAPKVVSPAPHGRLWTTQSLARGGAPLSLTLAGKIPGEHATAAVELLRGAKAVRQLKVERRGDQLVARLGPDAIRAGGARAGPAGLTLSLRAKLLPRAGVDLDVADAEAPPMALELASLADYPAGRASVYVARVAPTAGDGWFAQSGSVQPAQAAAGVHLASGRDLVRLASLLRGAGAFAIETERATTKVPSGAINVVRDGALVAQVTEKASSTRAVRHVREALHADLAFAGPASAFLGSGATVAATRTTDARWQETDITLVGQGRTTARISKSLLARHPAAWDVVARQGRALFAGPVKVLDPPVTPAPRYRADARTVQALASRKVAIDELSMTVPKRLIFVDGISPDGEPSFLALDHRKFNALGLVTAASGGQSAFALSLNPAAKRRLAKLAQVTKGKEGPRQSAYALQAMILAEADAVVLSPRDGAPWTIAVASGDGLRPLASAPAPAAAKATDAATVHAWVLATLGIKDRLAATSGGAALILAPSNGRVGAQGVLVGATDATARAIVEIVGTTQGPSGRFAVVSVVGSLSEAGGQPLPLGSRVLWE